MGMVTTLLMRLLETCIYVLIFAGSADVAG